jgi:hypothetical protein
MSLARKVALTCAAALGAAVGDIDVAQKAILLLCGENREIYTLLSLLNKHSVIFKASF